MGTLYIVATPIGNLSDITLRALEVLRSVDVIACEDTRTTGNLLKKYGIAKKRLLVLEEQHEEQQTYRVLEELEKEASVALVSESGTPLVSDPGYRLVSLAKKHNIPVIPVPGPSAFVTALSASGLPTHNVFFAGFVPKSSAKRKRLFESVKSSFSSTKLYPTIVFYESPHRFLKCLEDLKACFGNIEIVVGREITKMYEEIKHGTVQAFLDEYSEKRAKGELCVLFSYPRGA